MKKSKIIRALTLASLRAMVASAEVEGWKSKGSTFRDRGKYCVVMEKSKVSK